MPDEPDTYDLAFDPDDESESSASPAPTKKPQPASKEPAPPPADEADTFDLKEPQINDPRSAGTASAPAKRPTQPLDDEPATTEPEEPVAVSPARAQAIREEQRIRAAQELAEADARKKKLILTVVGGLVALGIVAYLVIKIVM